MQTYIRWYIIFLGKFTKAMLSKVCHTQEVYLGQMIYNVSGQVYQHPLYWMTIPMSDDISFPWASFLMYFPLKEWTYVRWYTMAVGNCINIYYLEWLHLCQMIYHFRGQVSWCMSHPEGELISDDIQCQVQIRSRPKVRSRQEWVNSTVSVFLTWSSKHTYTW